MKKLLILLTLVSSYSFANDGIYLGNLDVMDNEAPYECGAVVESNSVTPIVPGDSLTKIWLTVDGQKFDVEHVEGKTYGDIYMSEWEFAKDRKQYQVEVSIFNGKRTSSFGHIGVANVRKSGFFSDTVQQCWLFEKQ